MIYSVEACWKEGRLSGHTQTTRRDLTKDKEENSRGEGEVEICGKSPSASLVVDTHDRRPPL